MTIPITSILISLLFIFLLFTALIGFVTILEMCNPFLKGIGKFFGELIKAIFDEIGKSIARRRIRRSVIFKKRVEGIFEKIKLNKERSHMSTIYIVHLHCLVDDEICFFFKRRGYVVEILEAVGNRHIGHLRIIH